ncbi:zinc finger MYM-type protein 1-like [Centroberyx gerrardi]
MCEGDSRLQRHYDAQPIFKGTSSTVQNELLDCMYEVYREEIAKQVDETSFVAIQADETTDVSCKSQMVVVLRYMLPDNTVTERFLEFVEVKDKTGLGLSNSIKGVLEPLKLGDKLIAQTYDGAAVMSGNVCGVQTLMKETYPHAQFVHCYAHQLNLTLQQLCSARMSVLKVFFADLTAFATFFSGAPKRVAALAEATQRRIPRPPAVRWNFKSRTVSAVWENRAALLQCMEDIRTQPGWDEATISEAYGLSKKLRDRAFLQLLEFFSLPMPEVDVLYNTLQKRSIDAPGISSALTRFKENVQNMWQQTDELAATAHDGADEPGRRVTNTAPVMKEACDTVISQVEQRFSQSDHLIAAKLVDSSLFPQFVLSFLTSELDCAVKLWPVGNEEKLKSELTTLYRHTELHTGKTALSLLTSIHENNLEEAFAETITLLKIIVTTPMTTSESERNFSTLKRIKTFTRNTMGQPRLNALAMLSIESQLIQQLHDFIPKVIEKFAQRKNRLAAFLFK